MKTLLFSILTFLLLACSNTPSISPEKRILNGDYTAYEELTSCGCGELVRKENAYYDKKDSLYTGTCYTYYANSKNKMEVKQLLKGYLFGYYVVLDEKGDTLTKSLYKNGKLIPNAKANASCNCKELHKKNGISYLNSIPYTGTCYTYYPNSENKYTEAEYKDGLIDGWMIVYDQSGNILTSTKYSKGVIE